MWQLRILFGLSTCLVHWFFIRVITGLQPVLSNLIFCICYSVVHDSFPELFELSAPVRPLNLYRNGLPGISQHLGSTILCPVPRSGRDKPFRPVSSIFIQEPDCRSDACTVFLWPFKPDSYPSSLCLIQIELRIGCVL